jgi:hypothetical protein
VYCSIDKIDLAARVDGRPVAVQTDHRRSAEIESEPELSVLFAMARVLNARSHLEEGGHRGAPVHYALDDEPPALLREALAAVGGTIERGRRTERLGAACEETVGELADRCFASLAQRVKTRVGSRDVAIALRMLEDQTFADPPGRDDEPRYWARVLELAALAGELLRAKYPGRWVQTDRALVPFGFQVDSGAAVMFPTNRAQRVIEDGPDESLFKLLVAAEETVHHPTDATTGRLMPSLRDRRDIELDEVVWRPVVDDQGPLDLPVIVCGIDGESTFGMIRREALPKSPDAAFAEAIVNLGDEEVICEEVEVGGVPIIIVSGSFYAAEKVLDPEFMRSIHDQTGSSLLAVSTPARGCLLVTAAYDDPGSLAQFSAIAHARYQDGGGRGISPAVLLVDRGRVAGYVRGPNDPPAEPSRDTGTMRAQTEPAIPGRSSDESTSRGRSLLRRLLGRK